VYGLVALLRGITDGRQAARIPTESVLRAVLVMVLARMGSLNRLERSRPNGYWKKWLGDKFPSADVIGDVGKVLHVAGVRQGLRQLYERRKRNKSVKPLEGGLVALALDGHECACSDLQEWEGCLVRQVQTAAGSMPQYYQRIVVASLVFQGGCLLLDAEVQKPGEDEVAAATRLFQRVVGAFPKAFQVVVADGLYARADFFQQVLAHHKEIIAVLKDERRDLLGDARSLFQEIKPVTFLKGKTRCQCWDVEGLTSWGSLGRPVRVVRTLETTPIKPRLAKKEVEQTVEWTWVTTLSVQRASPRTVVRVGHGRWSIENEGGFNELVNTWKADHVYTHHANAILAFRLLTMLAYNLFHSFHRLNLKPVLRLRLTLGYLLDLVTTDFYQHEDLPRFHPP
jgi:hypothetical protein